MKRGMFFIGTVLAFIIGSGIAYTLLRTGPHAFSDAQCPECHAVIPEKGRRETLRLTAPETDLCARCHKTLENTVSHPVDIVPTRALPPPDFPLSYEGKMTCSTCHDIHESSNQIFGVASAFLRRQIKGRELCAICHEDSAGHASMIGTAHMKYRAEDLDAGVVDPVSRACLSCHDGTLGPAETVAVGTWEHGTPLTRFDPRGSHPIGVDYLRAFARHRGLRPMGTLNPAIKLIEGKVGCSSCHDLFSNLPGRLVMSNNGSRLCLACHDK